MSRPEVKRKVRCAVYTRVSSDERLAQEFNSLDAQRAAGEAYVASQSAEAGCSSRTGTTMAGSAARRWRDRR